MTQLLQEFWIYVVLHYMKTDFLLTVNSMTLPYS